MNYLPQFAILFLPFGRLPKWAGDLLWRLFQMMIYVSSIRRLAGVAQRPPNDLFLLVSLLALPAALGSVMNGQSNLLMAGALGHATVDLIGNRRWAATLWLLLGLIAKPIAIVMILLVVATDLAMIPPMCVGMIVTLLVPGLFDSWQNVYALYSSWFQQIVLIAPSTEHRFDDINGLLRTLNVDLPMKASFLLRALAAFLTLAISWVGARRLCQPYRAFALLGLSAGYLMLFNPRTESNSYVILSHAIGVWAARLLIVECRRVGWLLVGLALALGNASLGNTIWPLTKLWLKPVVASVFVGFLGWDILRRRLKDSCAERTP